MEEKKTNRNRVIALAAVFLLQITIGLGILYFTGLGQIKELKISVASLEADVSSAEEAGRKKDITAETTAAPVTTQSQTETTEESVPEPTNPLEDDYRYKVASEYGNLGVIVNVNNFLNIREKPNLDANILGKGTLYSAFEITDKEGEWYKIRVGEIEGYVHSDYVATGDTAVIYAMEHCNVDAYALEDDTPLYRSPNEAGTVVTTLNDQGHYIVMDSIGDWIKLLAYDTVIGYVKADRLGFHYSMTEPFFFTDSDGKVTLSQERLDIINTAFEYFGGTYVWGGTTLGVGVDCSGYVLRIFEQFGYNLPRLSSEQARWGTKVDSMEDARPGDLLFFHGYRNGRVTSGVGHVAIYIGNGKMIHAASEARGIVVDTYNFLEEPIGIRRIVND